MSQQESTDQAPRVRGLTTYKVKVIALALVCIGTLGVVLLRAAGTPQSIPVPVLTVGIIGQIVALCAVPIYAWLLVQGYIHTASLGRYALRLGILAVVSEIPYDLAQSGVLFDWTNQNPVFGLVICLIVIKLIDSVGPTRGSKVALAILIVVFAVAWMLLLRVGGIFGINAIGLLTLGYVLIFRYMSKRQNTMMMAATSFSGLGMAIPAMGLIAVHAANKTLGYTGKVVPVLFYALYPLHLLILWGLTVLG